MVFKSILFGILIGWLTVGAWFTASGMATQSAAFICGAIVGRIAWWLVAIAVQIGRRTRNSNQFEKLANEA